MLIALSVTSCGEDEIADPAQAAQAAAQAMANGDFSEVPLAQSNASALADAAANLQEGLADTQPQVEVTSVEVTEPEEDSERAPVASVSFETTWDMEPYGADDADFSYSTQASMTHNAEEDIWVLDAEPSVLLPDYSGHEPVGIATTAAERGRIMDGEGRAMVYNRVVVHVGLDKSQLAEDEQEDAARQLAEAVNIDADNYAEQVENYGDEAFVEAIVLRREGSDISISDVEHIPGVLTVDGDMSLAETREFARPLLGFVGPVTAEHLEEDPSLAVGDWVGLSGIQSQYQDQLRGTPGLRIHLDGDTLWESEPETGEDIGTTLVPRLQNLAQDIVDDQDSDAAVVAIRPSDGGILAAASAAESDQTSVATSGLYAPGSTFKAVSALAMLRSGLEPGSTVSCPNHTTVHGQEFGNVSGYPEEYLGDVSFRDAVAVSCNTLFAAAYDDVSSEELYEAAMDLGLNNENRMGLPAMMGSVPEEADLNLHAANLFGQGEVQASPLGMATVAASIGAGHTVAPYLVDREDIAEQEEAEEEAEENSSAEAASADAADENTGGLSEDEAEDLLDLLAGTVEFGTLESMENVPGDQVYAKTGTAEVGSEDDGYSHTWVIAVQGDLAVAIFLEDGEFGGSTNGPLLHEFLVGARDIL